MIKKYKPISSEVEAIQWTGDNYDELKEFCGKYINMYNRCVFLDTPDAGDICNVSDYILKISDGLFKAMSEEQFKKQYEEVVDGNER